MREAYPYSEHRAVEEIRLIGDDGFPESELGNWLGLAEEMVIRIAKRCRCKRRSKETEFWASFEETQEGGIEENINKEFFEIKIVTIPEFGGEIYLGDDWVQV